MASNYDEIETELKKGELLIPQLNEPYLNSILDK